jgi:hypothetical protein
MLDTRLKEIDKDLRSVQDRIRELSKQDPQAPAQTQSPSRPASPEKLPDPAPETERDRPKAAMDARFADYLASSFRASQTAGEERSFWRNKVVFTVSVAIVALILWILSRFL